MKTPRSVILQVFVVAVFAVIVGRLFYLQVINNSYKESADNNALRREVQNPARGEIFDRNGEFLVQSKEVYDLMIIPRDVKQFDTLLLSSIVGVPVEKLREDMAKARKRSWRQGQVIAKQLPKEVKIKLDERSFPGFYTVYRTLRSYPRKIAGNLLGYVGEVNQATIDHDKYYRGGDYIGKTGIELAYEDVLRGKKGVKVNMVDVHGMVKGSYTGGIYDTLATPGTALTCTIDGAIQALAEELLVGKVGSVVAIEPSTGEILAMASSPTYDPEQMVGRNNSFTALNADPRKPFFNRAVMSEYPPGSIFKLVNGLIGLQEEVLKPEYRYSCNGGYKYSSTRTLGCHAHYSPLDLYYAIQTSCNAYFCYVFRNTIENKKKYPSVKEGFDAWETYVRSFGFGRKLDSDFIDERNGKVPSRALYDERYRGSWNAHTVISLAIGQGELGVSPLQMANLAAIIANRGHYYIPHVVKEIHGRDSIDARFYEPHQTLIERRHFETIVEGMWRAVNQEGGTGFWRARVPGLDICGKTGTAENPQPGDDHGTFLCFAPRDNPKIAVSVYIEHGHFGASSAAPIASLIIEQYLTGTIGRPEAVEYVKNLKIAYPHYDRQRTK